MSQKFVNNFSATVAQTFGSSDTFLHLSSAAGLPVLSGADYLLLTVFRKTGVEESGHEVVKVTAIVADQLTVERSVEGAAASLFNVGDRVEARVTAKTLNDLADDALVAAHTSNTSNPHGVTAAQVGLGNVDNTSDADKPVSTAQATAIGLKQDVLVSGTNIKTVNSTSLLGSGDIATLQSSDIGVTVQAYDVDTAKLDVAQSWTAQQTFTELKETTYTLATGGSIALDPANGSIQTSTLASDPTFTDSLETGQTVVLMINGGASYTVTWPTTTWCTASGNAAPTLTANDTLVFWKTGTTLYAAYVGSFA